MKKVRFISKAIVLVTIMASAALGCASASGDGGSSHSGQSISIDSACSSLCDRGVACDSSMDKSVCIDKCKNENAAVLPRLRTDIVSSTLSCYQAKDCASVLGGSAWKDCVGTAEASIAPSDAAQKFCSDLVSVANKCNGKASDGSCLDSAKIYNDGALGDADTCTEKACSDVNDCIKAALP